MTRFLQVLDILKKVFSLDTAIYLAIVIVLVTAIIRCILPVSAATRRLRRASRVILAENKQNKEKKSWTDLHFLGDALQGTWADFLQNAEQRDAHGETCDVCEYVNEDTVIYPLGATRLAELAPGLLTSLGILGTFLGLVQGLSGLTLSAADTTALLAAMEKLIGGMSTAFLTSVAGVVASLTFNILYNHYVSGCQKAIDRFCEVFGLYAMPKPVSQETAMLTLQQEQTAYLRQAAEDIGQKLAVQMEQSIMRAMLPVQRSMDNFIVATTQAQVEGIDQISRVFVQRMNVALGQEFDNLRRTLAETGAQQQQAQQELRAAADAVSQMTRDVINMHQMSQGLLEHFEAYVRDMDTSRQQVGDTQKKTLELLDQMSRTSNQQAAQLAQMQEYQAMLASSSQQYAAWMDRFLAGTQEQTRATEQEMARFVAELQRSTQEMNRASEQFARRTQDALAGATTLFDKNITGAVRELDDTVRSMHETTRIMPQLLSQSRDRYAQQVDQFVMSLMRLQKTMDELSAEAEKLAKGKE